MAEPSQYEGFSKVVRRYWSAYGGWKAVLTSPYTHVALAGTLLSWSVWSGSSWEDLPIQILPNIIGFSLGGYAIWLAIGDEKFRIAISGKSSDGDESPFIQVNAAFLHFVVLQILALAYAVISSALPGNIVPTCIIDALAKCVPWALTAGSFFEQAFSFFGYFLFLYALLSALAATFAVFRIATWLDLHQANEESEDEGSE